MKRTLLRIFPLVAMILGFTFGSAAYASDDNETNFTGVVESLPDTASFIGDWRVSGRTVHVSAAARIEQEHGPVAAGATVKVEGATRADNSVDAREINIKVADDDENEVKFVGTIESLPGTPAFRGDWRVGGRTIHGGDDFGGGSGGGGDDGGGGGGQDVAREAQLNPTGVDNDAGGKVKTQTSSSRQTLEIEGEKLDSNAQYNVVVDGFSVGNVTTDGSGSFKIDLSTENGSLPAQVRPVSSIQRVDVIDSQGRVVLTGGPPA